MSFWNEVKEKQGLINQDLEEQGEIFEIVDPVLPRTRSRPARIAEFLPVLPQYSTIEEKFESDYLKAFEILTKSLKDRFTCEEYKVYMMLESLLLKAARGQDYKAEFKKVTEFYGSDFNVPVFETQLLTFGVQFKDFKSSDKIVLKDIIEFMKLPGNSHLLCEIGTALKLLLTIPATNAESERSFSNLRRTKNYLRNSTGQARLNWIMILNIHKERTAALNLVEVFNEFISANDRRSKIFARL